MKDGIEIDQFEIDLSMSFLEEQQTIIVPGLMNISHEFNPDRECGTVSIETHFDSDYENPKYYMSGMITREAAGLLYSKTHLIVPCFTMIRNIIDIKSLAIIPKERALNATEK